MPPTLNVAPQLIPLEPLTPTSFSPFGTVVENPLGALQPHTPLPTNLPANAAPANQNTAVKFSSITTLTNHYSLASASQPGTPVATLFACKPRALRRPQSQLPVTASAVNHDAVFRSTGETVSLRLDVAILERHPFASQTFVPLGLDARDEGTAYVVVVAPTDPNTPLVASPQKGSWWSGLFPYPSARRGKGEGPKGSGAPRLDGVRAFLASGNQAVTYGAGTWHAPMIVLGQRAIDFVVVQHVNGVAEDDCQEVLLAPAKEGAEGLCVEVRLPVSALPNGVRAKL